MKFKLIILFLILSCSSTDNKSNFSNGEIKILNSLSQSDLITPIKDISNKDSDNPDAAIFGQKLFFDPIFAGKLLDGDNDGSINTLGLKGQTGKVACSGCHIPEANFIDNRSLNEQITLAAGWGRRKTPSLLDVGQKKLLTWDGRHDALYNQIFTPIESPVEMNSSRLYVAEQIYIKYKNDYELLFGSMSNLNDSTIYPQLSAELTGCQPLSVDGEPICSGTEHGIPGDNAEFDSLSIEEQDTVNQVVVNVGKAIGAYERLLTCGTTRFDKWLSNSDMFSDSEINGAKLFIGKGQCINCHSGPFFSDFKFHNVGLQPGTVAVVFIDSNDLGASKGLNDLLSDPLNVSGKFSDGNDGRLPVSIDSNLLGAFMTPILRCDSSHPSFMHTGQLANLNQVISFFSNGGNIFGYPGINELKPLNLTNQEQEDLIAFLKTLDGPGPLDNLKQKE